MNAKSKSIPKSISAFPQNQKLLNIHFELPSATRDKGFHFCLMPAIAKNMLTCMKTISRLIINMPFMTRSVAIMC